MTSHYATYWCRGAGPAHYVTRRVNRAAAATEARRLGALRPDRLYWCERVTVEDRHALAVKKEDGES